MDISIIIVSYNTKKLLKQTIESVMQTIGQVIDYEIIVSDNCSNDGSCELVKKLFPQVKLIENEANLGFSKANNVAIKESKGRYILLLNSDTMVIENCIENSIKFVEDNQRIGVLGCKLLLENGELDHACKRGFPTPEASLWYMLKIYKLFPANKRFGQYKMSHLTDDEINEVDSLTGAFMLLRREVIDEVGLLDEQFFMYGEDLDWCFRIKEAGWKIVYYPEAVTIHYKGGSSKKKRYKTIYEFHRAMYLFYNKHYLKKYNFIITFFVYLGIGCRLIMALIINLFKSAGKFNFQKEKKL